MAATPIKASSDIFSVYDKATLYCPAASVDKYRQTTPWNKFENIKTEGGGGGFITIIPDRTSYTLNIGETVMIGYTLNASGDATLKSKSWSSSDAAVATVQDGLVKAIGEGSATIRLVVTDNSGNTYQNDWYIVVTDSNTPPDDPDDEETPSTNLKYTEISDTEVAVIGYEGTALEDVVIPNQVRSGSTGNIFNVVEIRSSAFAGSPYVRSITIPENIHTIAPGAFKNCSNLEEVNYRARQVTTENDHHSNLTFGNCPKFTTLNIGKRVKALPKFIFRGTRITSVVIPDNVTVIGNDCFAECQNLSDITIGKGVVTIEWSAFGFERGTTSPETTLRFNAANLKKYYGLGEDENIPAEWTPMIRRNVSKIYFGAEVNSRCRNLLHDCTPSDIYCESSIPPSLTGQSLNSTSKSQCLLHVPKNSSSAYRVAAIWKEFYNIVEDSNFSGIDDVAVDGDSYVEVYNLNGIKVYDGLRSEMSLARGIYIVRMADRVEKIAIR
ncbi:MAG: leucine-rich repeat protein [Muribaculum sp.]|nr:leucine-rich repeat protein [Muribaculum sp.]